MAPSPAQDVFGLVGTVLERQFRVDALVGEGGFGVVYKGWHLTLDQPIAIKALKMPGANEAAAQATVIARFREEAKLSYVLSQATLSVVRTIDFGATTAPSGAWVPFAVLEWLEGETLAQDLARRRAAGARGRSLSDAMTLLEPAARALAIAHQRRIAHRDIKPGNFFLLSQPSGSPIKLLDFGIAKVMGDGPGGAKATRSSMLAFTPQYAAPEQIDPRRGDTGPWTDVYAFALMLTEVLTDRPPFDAPELALVLAQVGDAARRPTPRARGAAVPDAFDATCARALAVDPKARFANAGELWAALEAAAGAAAVRVVPTPALGALPALAAPASYGLPSSHISSGAFVAPPGAASGAPGPGLILSPAAPSTGRPAPLAAPLAHVPAPVAPHAAPVGAATWLAILLGVGLALGVLALAAFALLVRR